MTILMAIRDLALLCVRVCRCGVVSLSKKNLLTLLQSSRLLNGNLVAWCQVPTGEAAHPMPGNNWVSKCSTVLLSFSSVRLLYVAALTGLLPPSVYQYWDAWHHSDTRALCSKSSWGRVSYPQEDCPVLIVLAELKSSTTTSNCYTLLTQLLHALLCVCIHVCMCLFVSACICIIV